MHAFSQCLANRRVYISARECSHMQIWANQMIAPCRRVTLSLSRSSGRFVQIFYSWIIKLRRWCKSIEHRKERKPRVNKAERVKHFISLYTQLIFNRIAWFSAVFITDAKEKKKREREIERGAVELFADCVGSIVFQVRCNFVCARPTKNSPKVESEVDFQLMRNSSANVLLELNSPHDICVSALRCQWSQNTGRNYDERTEFPLKTHE